MELLILILREKCFLKIILNIILGFEVLIFQMPVLYRKFPFELPEKKEI